MGELCLLTLPFMDDASLAWTAANPNTSLSWLGEGIVGGCNTGAGLLGNTAGFAASLGGDGLLAIEGGLLWTVGLGSAVGEGKSGTATTGDGSFCCCGDLC